MVQWKNGMSPRVVTIQIGHFPHQTMITHSIHVWFNFTYIAHNNEPSMHVNIPAPGILWAKRVRIFSQLKPQLKERLSRKRPKILCHKNTCLAILCLWPFFGDRWKSRDPLTQRLLYTWPTQRFGGIKKSSEQWKNPWLFRVYNIWDEKLPTYAGIIS